MSIKLYHSFINDKDLEFTRMHENSSIVDVVYDKKIIARLLDRSHTTYKYIEQLELYNWSNSITTEMIIRTELCIKFLYYYNKYLMLKDEEVLLDYKEEIENKYFDSKKELYDLGLNFDEIFGSFVEHPFYCNRFELDHDIKYEDDYKHYKYKGEAGEFYHHFMYLFFSKELNKNKLENKEFLEEYSALKLKVEDMNIVTEEYLKTVFILSKSIIKEKNKIFHKFLYYKIKMNNLSDKKDVSSFKTLKKEYKEIKKVALNNGIDIKKYDYFLNKKEYMLYFDLIGHKRTDDNLDFGTLSIKKQLYVEKYTTYIKDELNKVLTFYYKQNRLIHLDLFPVTSTLEEVLKNNEVYQVCINGDLVILNEETPLELLEQECLLTLKDDIFFNKRKVMIHPFFNPISKLNSNIVNMDINLSLPIEELYALVNKLKGISNNLKTPGEILGNKLEKILTFPDEIRVNKSKFEDRRKAFSDAFFIYDTHKSLNDIFKFYKIPFKEIDNFIEKILYNDKIEKKIDDKKHYSGSSSSITKILKVMSKYIDNKKLVKLILT